MNGSMFTVFRLDLRNSKGVLRMTETLIGERENVTLH